MKKSLLLTLAAVLLAVVPGGANAIEVALVGDDARLTALEQLAQDFNAAITESNGVRRAATPDHKLIFTAIKSGRDPVSVANQLLNADLAFVVVDSTDGPLPISREHVVLARQTRVPLTGIYFAETRKVDDAELLELEELEMRELLSIYKLEGDKAPVFSDSAKGSNGVPALRRFLTSGLSTRPPEGPLRMGSEFHGTFYLLTEPEGRERNRATTITNGSKLEIWISGAHRSAVAKTQGKHWPGDVPDFAMELDAPAKMAEGSRLLLIQSGMVVGVGVVAEIVR